MHQLGARVLLSNLSHFLLIDRNDNNKEDKLRTPLHAPVAVNPIEAMYAIQSMGRGDELTRLMDLELPQLKEQLCMVHPAEGVTMSQQMVRVEMDYILQLQISRQEVQDKIDIYLNVSSSAFVVKFDSKLYSLITAKSICNLIYQLMCKQKPINPEMTSSEIMQSKQTHLSIL
jgi:hypothetical protein